MIRLGSALPLATGVTSQVTTVDCRVKPLYVNWPVKLLTVEVPGAGVHTDFVAVAVTVWPAWFREQHESNMGMLVACLACGCLAVQHQQLLAAASWQLAAAQYPDMVCYN